MTQRRPALFVGSSKEGLSVAEAIQVNLDVACEVAIWNQGVFGLSAGTVDSLAKAIGASDFALFVLTPDDIISSRGSEQDSPRDNVLFEAGLSVGALGLERTFLVFDRAANLKLPSDLAGLTHATF